MDEQSPSLIVGVGASAGGLAAIESLLKTLPADTNLALVVVMHLPRDHPSALPEILGRSTKLPVQFVQHLAPVLAGHVYVATPDSTVTLVDDHFVLQPRNEDTPQRPIDLFLCSLAEDRGDRAAGVLLSGSGSDGTLGLQAVKQQGGFTLVQGPSDEGPLHSSMPHSAIAAGAVDLALPVGQIAPRLIEFARDQASPPTTAGADPGGLGASRSALYHLLLQQVGHDFSGYKEHSFGRRVRRRMQVLRIADPEDYVAALRQSPDEVRLLFQDLLIGVTSFFRDPMAYAALERQVIPRLFEGKGANDQVRIWVPGCASGEEVYSLAILVLEHLETLKQPPRVLFFATDIDAAALAVARAGRYPAPLLNEVSPARLKRFFHGGPTSYVINKQVRELCVFSLHSVVRDPPFSRLDLISCRNLLIYFGSVFQNQVIPAFHFALRPSGYLFLGASENVSQHATVFAPLDRQHRIFQRRDHVRVRPQMVSLPLSERLTIAARSSEAPPAAGRVAALRGAVGNRVLDRFAPPHVLVNGEGTVVHFSARTGKYLEAAVGQPDRHLLSMVRPGLRLDLRAALHEAARTGQPAWRRRLTLNVGEQAQLVDIGVEPLDIESAGDGPHYLVIFNDVSHPTTPTASPSARPEPEGVTHLERELRQTRELLQTTIEEYEDAVEELKTSNEELQSMNEELQSANEELETSKEELQSINEELHTVNGELTAKIEEVHRANSDLRNVFESTQVATVFLDETLVIRSFTPAMTEIFNLVSGDRGRPLTDIVSQIEDFGDLKGDIEAVFRSGDIVERRVHGRGGRKHYLMRILPYRSAPPAIDGALLVFVDISRLVLHELQQQVMVEELNHRVRNMLAMVTALARQTLRQSGTMVDFERDFLKRVQTIAKSYVEISNRDWAEVELRTILADAVGLFHSGSEQRFQLDGPVVRFNASTAMTLGMMLHELATNAAKYGALSTSKGRVTVTWQETPRGLALTWIESGGPPVKQADHAGFGSALIQRLMDAGFGGAATFDYQPQGLRVDMLLPADATMYVVERKGGAQVVAPSNGADRAVHP